MEIRELLEIMLNNVKNGEEPDYGLLGYNGVININQPEQVHRKPHTYITFDEFREIRNTPDHNTAHYRLNLAIEKLMAVAPAEPVQPVTFPIPNGFYVDDSKIPTYQEMRRLGYYDSVLKLYGWIKESAPLYVSQLPSVSPSVMPAVVPDGYLWNVMKGDNIEFYGKFIAKGWTDEQLISEGYLLQKPTREFFKPFIAWVCGDCNHVWPKADYLFTESQFSNIKNSEFRVKLVAVLNLRIEDGKPFNYVVSNISIGETFDEVKRREELVNKRLNEIIQKL